MNRVVAHLLLVGNHLETIQGHLFPFQCQMGSNVDALLLLRSIALADVGVEQEGVSQISKTDLAGRGGVLKIAWRLLISRDGDMSFFSPFDMILWLKID